MSFTSDEIWSHLPATGRSESVHLELFPSPEDLTGKLPVGFDVAGMITKLGTLLWVRTEALKLWNLHETKSASAVDWKHRFGLCSVPTESLQIRISWQPCIDLEGYRDQLRYLFIVSDVVLGRSPGSNGQG